MKKTGGGSFRTLGWGFLLFGFVALGGRTVNAATWTVDEDNVTNAAPLVLRETLTITGTGDGFVQTGAVSGTGDLHFSLPGKTAFLLAPNTSAGDLYVDLGTLTVTNAAALGRRASPIFRLATSPARSPVSSSRLRTSPRRGRCCAGVTRTGAQAIT